MNNVTRSIRNWLAPLGLAFFVSACSETPQVHYAEGDLGKLQFQVAYMPSSPNQTEARMVARVSSLVGHLEQQLSTSNEGSEVVRINKLQSTEAMVLTRDLEDFVRAGLDANSITEGGLTLFTEVDSHSLFATPLVTAIPQVSVENHQLKKLAPGVQLAFDPLLSGFVADRLAILMGQMGIEHYQITVNGQRRAQGKQRFMDQLSHTVDGLSRNHALGHAVCRDGSDIYVLSTTAIQASAVAQWLATMAPTEALIVAERLNLAVDIYQHVNGNVTRYNSSAFPST